MARIVIPEGAAYTLGCIDIPVETPVSVILGHAWQLVYDGRTYQATEPPRFLDVETGEEVEVVLEGW